MHDNRETATGEASKPQHIKDRTFNFAVEIVGFCQKLNVRNDVSRTLGRQLLRSGTAIGANVEEAQAGQSVADFISKCSIALKEARETIYWLRLMRACDLSLDQKAERLFKEGNEISRIIGSIIVRTRNGTKRK